jgi:acyl-CoA synthetase (AMP-forming)/AMP-acid ligase II
MLDTVADHLKALRAVAGTGLIAPVRPDAALKIVQEIRKRGPIGAVPAIAAVRFGSRTGMVDELGSLTFDELNLRANALTNAWRRAGLRHGDGIAIMCRDHRGFADTMAANTKLGGSAIYLNTSFAGPQLVDVMKREGAKALVYDEEFAGLLENAPGDILRYRAWIEDADKPVNDDPSLEEIVTRGDRSEPEAAPADSGGVVLLTSGTTGTPKGAPRKPPRGIMTAGALFDRVPFKVQEATTVAAPMFHSLGLACATMSLSMGSTLSVRRRFDAEATLKMIADNRSTALVAVPVMLQRIVDLPQEVIDRHDTSSLRIILSGGSALPGALATKVLETFGGVLYNLYGSTEVSVATIATPEDLSVAPDTVGKALLGTKVALYDDDGRPVTRVGDTGRIFVGADMAFEGYTGGGTKEQIDGLLSSGDVGHFDSAGRLYVDGRDDDMIVSGGENLFPHEVEELLAAHDGIKEASVIGVDDEEFGKRLKAFVVGEDSGAPSEKEVKDYVRENLARFKVPREVVFMDELPRNPTGKILKRELREL